jgi:glycosyltransferase involved in cell wall biosynthesis
MAPLIVAYFGVLALLAGMGLYRLGLVISAARYPTPRAETPGSWPLVLVQLPLYNERFVAERLLRRVGALDYPRSRVILQVLDDSDDETRWVVDRGAAALRRDGWDVDVVRRPDRRGFKAGALAFGLDRRPEADLVAIFDADFVPPVDFLRRTVPHLCADPDVGLVQARWAHLNRDASWLTRAQAVFLDGHFGVEHAGRARRGHFFNFNGTAGVWRRAAIVGAGGWSSDTITEDLDLSYRAQLAGWRFVYADDVVVPAELPAAASAFRSQQARWVRGSVETARKHVGTILGRRGLGVRRRIDALVHLGNNFAYLLMAVLAVLLPLAVVVRDRAGWRVFGGEALLSRLDVATLSLGTAAMIVFYAVGLGRAGAGGLRRGIDLAFALCLGAGMSLANATEVLRGLASRGSEFVRTPKAGDDAQAASRAYGARGVLRRATLEMLFGAYHAAAFAYAAYFQLWGALPFLGLYLIGFAALVGGAVREAWALRSRAVIVQRAAA